MASIPTRDRLIVALDVPNVDAAKALVSILGETVGFYKIGLQLAMSGGLELARSLSGAGKQVFLDMKLLDIENTVERAARAAAATGATFLTVHGHDRKTLRAAVAGKAGSQLKILAVTVLTNLDANDLREQSITLPFTEVVLSRAKLAHETGCEGVVASGREVREIRSAIGADLLIVTPAIRLPTDAVGDQTRAATPGDARMAGADYLVVGRPITQAPDPRRAAEVFAALIDNADTAMGGARPG